MKTPVLIVIIASVVVLCTLPALYIFLAYHTYRERQRWKVDHDVAVEKMEAEASATSHRIYSSSAQGRAPPAVHYHNHNHRQQPPAPPRLAPTHNSWAPPPPPLELDVFQSSRNHLSSQADAAPRAVPQGSGRSNNRPTPGLRTTKKSGGAGRSSRGSREKQQQQQQQQEQQSPSSSGYGTKSDGSSQGPRPFPPASRLPPPTQWPPASQF